MSLANHPEKNMSLRPLALPENTVPIPYTRQPSVSNFFLVGAQSTNFSDTSKENSINWLNEWNPHSFNIV